MKLSLAIGSVQCVSMGGKQNRSLSGGGGQAFASLSWGGGGGGGGDIAVLNLGGGGGGDIAVLTLGGGGGGGVTLYCSSIQSSYGSLMCMALFVLTGHIYM